MDLDLIQKTAVSLQKDLTQFIDMDTMHYNFFKFLLK